MKSRSTAGILRQEGAVVPRGVAFAAKLIALLGCAAFVIAALIAAMHPLWEPARLSMQGESSLKFALRGFGVMVVSLFFAAYIMLVGYVYGDARHRGMPAALWAWLVVLVPNLIGFIVYFIVRRRIITTCPRCQSGIEAGYLYCPHCGNRIDVAA